MAFNSTVPNKTIRDSPQIQIHAWFMHPNDNDNSNNNIVQIEKDEVSKSSDSAAENELHTNKLRARKRQKVEKIWFNKLPR